MLVNSSKIDTSKVSKLFEINNPIDLKIEAFKDIVESKIISAKYRPEFYTDTSLHIKTVLLLVSKMCEISIDDIKSRKRNREIVEARQIYSILILKFSTVKVSLVQAGDAINKDHATIIHSLKQCLNLSETNIPFRKKLDRCIDAFTKEFTKSEHYILDFNNIPQY